MPRPRMQQSFWSGATWSRFSFPSRSECSQPPGRNLEVFESLVGVPRGRPVPRSLFWPAPPAGFVPGAPAPTKGPYENKGLGAFPPRPPGGWGPKERRRGPCIQEP